jgi:hypothetical protein
LWGNTYAMLATLSGYTIAYLVQQFHVFLAKEPPVLPPLDQSTTEEAFLLIDGLWFRRWYVLMVYRQAKNLTILHISVAGQEAGTKIAKDLRVLTTVYRFTGVVSDGGTGIIKAVNVVFPHIPHQICLAHMHRRIIAALGRYPRDYRIQELKTIADHVWRIESKVALRWWKEQLYIWITDNDKFLWEYKQDTEGHRWYPHKGARKAVRILIRLPDTSFTFLDHPTMPKTTNELEAQLGHLGKRWLAHRGLKKDRWENFMKWFVYFYNEEKLSRNKTKEAKKTNTII